MTALGAPAAARTRTTHDDAPPAGVIGGLDAEQLERIAAELDAIGDEVRADLGHRDADYIRRLIAIQRTLEVAGRGLLLASRRTPALAAGTAALTLSKVLSNMAIGHNLMHGQWDWMNDPRIHSSTWEWDAVSTSASWKYAHNFQHHQYTNVLGKDRDIGYSAMRVEPEQPWHPVYLLQPVYGVLMALVFEWGIALYDMELDAVKDGRKSKEQGRREVKAFLGKAARQVVKDGIVWPALSGRSWKRTLAANLTANLVRNVWVHTIVFMGHTPEEAETFPSDQLDDESRGEWYVRQMVGSANLEGTPLFHVMTGQLSYQVEHHLYPDVPANRYAEIAPRVRAVCERHGLAYNTGRLGPQYGKVVRRILRLSFPGG